MPAWNTTFNYVLLLLAEVQSRHLRFLELFNEQGDVQEHQSRQSCCLWCYNTPSHEGNKKVVDLNSREERTPQPRILIKVCKGEDCRERGVHRGSFQSRKQMYHERMKQSFTAQGGRKALPGSFDIEVFKFFEQKNFVAVQRSIAPGPESNDDGHHCGMDDVDDCEMDVDEEIRSNQSFDFEEDDIDR